MTIRLNKTNNDLYVIEGQLLGQLNNINKKSADFTALSKKNGGPTQVLPALTYFMFYSITNGNV
jgi:hypothetical protein